MVQYRQEGVICKKLDRVLVSKTWFQQYAHSYSVFESGGCSDHLRCRFYITEEVRRVRRPFKFVNHLTTSPGYHKEIEERWKVTSPLFYFTSAMFRFSKKLKDLKPRLRIMEKKMFGTISRRTKEAYKVLCDLQEETMKNPSMQAANEEAIAYEQWKILSDIEEGYLRQKAKLHWMKVGDQNNKAFYIAAKIREVRNNIQEIQCDDGQIVSTQEQIKSEAERYSRSFLL